MESQVNVTKVLSRHMAQQTGCNRLRNSIAEMFKDKPDHRSFRRKSTVMATT